MVTSLLSNPVASDATRKSGQPLTPEFRLLGLRPREARLEVIRGAVKETASDLKAAAEWDLSDSGRVARVAVAGYRLLDPRRRGTLFERVQLLLWTEEDVNAPAPALWAIPVEQSAAPASASGAVAVRESGRVIASPVGSPLPPPVTLAPPVTLPSPPVSNAVQSVAGAAQKSSSAEETQAALELFRTLRKRDRRAMALWVSIAALALSLVSTLGLVAALI